jgi:hypothetical protein
MDSSVSADTDQLLANGRYVVAKNWAPMLGGDEKSR